MFLLRSRPICFVQHSSIICTKGFLPPCFHCSSGGRELGKHSERGGESCIGSNKPSKPLFSFPLFLILEDTCTPLENLGICGGPSSKAFIHFFSTRPEVYSLHRVSGSFEVHKIDLRRRTFSAQLCFILDYTSSMKTQVGSLGISFWSRRAKESA